jgi:hypothetical protein
MPGSFCPIPLLSCERYLSMILTIVLLILAGIAKALQDTLNFHWSVSIFARWADQPNAFGRFIEWWTSGSSWQNKNLPNNNFIRLLTRTVLVPFTDGWHFFQFLHQSLWQSAIIFLLPPLPYSAFISWLIYIIAAKVIMGGVFELFWSHFLLSNSKISKLSGIEDDHFTFWDYYRTAPRIAGYFITAASFALLVGSHYLGAPDWSIVICVGFFFTLILYLFSKKKL